MEQLQSLIIGIDVGSTTVKATVVDPETKAIVWSDYQRHNTKQAEMVLEFLVRIGNEFSHTAKENIRVFITGSGGSVIAEHIGAKFVQEVNAVTMSVEELHPDVGSVVELGGQDAKMIIFKENEETGDKQAITSMNDKCASGTGATIDKCMIKVGLPEQEVSKLQFDDTKLHHVAAKCGVFAETDIVNLVKSSIPSSEIMCSLADAIVMQNLSVLTRGNTLRHKVLLLGGPNTYLPFLQQCWRKRIPESWEQRGYDYPKDVPLEELIFIPENAQYYAAYGAVMYGMHEPENAGLYKGIEELKTFITYGRKAKLGENAGKPLVKTREELEEFRAQYSIPRFTPASFVKGQTVEAVIGLDGGSTSSKAVLVDMDGAILLKEYQLSKGNPIQDTKELLEKIYDKIHDAGATLDIKGFGATGYAADVLEKTLNADVNIVETVAHMMSAVHYFGDIDVICDIGGQDIKVLFLKNGDIRNFRLSNQCSAGNGMLLQAMADQFGIPVQEYAETAFNASLSPKFSYGCAVFLDSDRVNFQKEGYAKEELLAGLAMVLPKNVWQYVVQIPRMAELGRKFVLQGGTQHNLAAVKAQVDYIKERVPDAEVYVHPHTGEAGAIGAAMETIRVVKRRGYSTFLGLESAIGMEYTSRNDESTRCHFCPNNCSRTFIDTTTPGGDTARYISGFSCEKGTVEDKEALVRLTKERNNIKKRYPNLVDYEARRMFQHIYDPAPMPDADHMLEDVEVKTGWLKTKRVTYERPFRRSDEAAANHRKQLRVGIPKVLNIWSTAPFWRTYFETLGLHERSIIFSDDTSEEMWQEGGKYGSIDPCYPSKVAQAHIHNLLFKKHAKKPLDAIVFPCITHIPSQLQHVMDSASCPIVAGAPEVIKAAFTKETDFFAVNNVKYFDPAVTFTEPNMLKKQLFEAFQELLQMTEDESDFAADEAWKALELFDQEMQEKGKAILEQVERENRLAILMIGRPYHSDPGLNHSVLDEFQVLGYPILSMRSIPKDERWLHRFFKNDLAEKRVEYALEVTDVWPENFSSNSVQKVWAAKFAARHPNVAVLDLSSFKCGHDAPTYGLIDAIISAAGTPYSALHDIDANKPSGSIKIRVKTYAHSLGLHEERLQDLAEKKQQLQQLIEKKQRQLMMKQRQDYGEQYEKDEASSL
ncbi:CoA-substrate-specific enzyme activase, putative [Evansella caseinilytica]|uniref:CoA-substrate-specific enzyme activase, putative n=1 Tax=Evansella caseinilytica TaxID=1503961 RepID=A0A1H3UQU9_9BACI|nr:BadF/BadG/BcrA/BcrD ATPase family protein [Evansella caseinilytica]SDZ64616.1 CoA-substrate-specific enzyme activase, putative [Evansella caseinilytica]